MPLDPLDCKIDLQWFDFQYFQDNDWFKLLASPDTVFYTDCECYIQIHVILLDETCSAHVLLTRRPWWNIKVLKGIQSWVLLKHPAEYFKPVFTVNLNTLDFPTVSWPWTSPYGCFDKLLNVSIVFQGFNTSRPRVLSIQVLKRICYSFA